MIYDVAKLHEHKEKTNGRFALGAVFVVAQLAFDLWVVIHGIR